jgi:hypothetical protein
VTRALRQSNTAFLESILNTIDPRCSNDELVALALSSSGRHREVVRRFVEAHPGSERDHATLKERTQSRGMVSFAPRRRYRDDSDDEFLRAEYAWLDDYPAEGDWVWGMDPARHGGRYYDG